jgi:hypothetical protein
MDFTELSNDELADATRALLDELHGRIDILDDPQRARGQRVLRVMHAAADALKDWAVDGGLIVIESGGDPKGP